jgi:hypothetical protein
MASLSRRDLTLEGELTDTDIYLIAINWVRYTLSKKGSQEYFDTSWASSIQIDMVLEQRFEDLWRLILAIHNLDQSMEVAALLSAGPIEDLLGGRGDEFIGQIETKAKGDPSFAKVLGGVWQGNMTDENWDRLQRVWDRRGWDGIPE